MILFSKHLITNTEMRKLFTLIALLAMMLPAMAQKSLSTSLVSKELAPERRALNMDYSRAELARMANDETRETACGTDTVLYPLLKGAGTDTLRGFAINGATNTYDIAGMWYRGYPGMTLTGVEFGARSNVPGTNIDVTVRVWASRPDTFPDSLTYSETFSFAPSPTFQGFSFTTPVTINGDYIITLENVSNDILAVFSNDYTLNRGAGENLSIVGFYNSQGGISLLPLLNAFTIEIDADWFIMPMVSYSIDTDFSLDPECLQPAVEASIDNQSSAILSSKFYNFEVFANTFFGTADSTFFVDYGDGTFDYADSSALSHTWTTADSNSFDVTLDALLVGYSQVCNDFTVKTYDEGVSAGFSATLTDDSVTISSTAGGVLDSVTYDYGDGSGTTSETSHVYSQIGSYTITQTVYGCGGPQSTTEDVTIAVASINNLTKQVMVYPNPSQGVFQIELTDGLNGILNVSVSNLMGQEITRAAGSNSLRLDLSNQTPGVYLLNGTYEGTSFTRKLVIE